MAKKIQASIENASILRKFTILFLLISVIPVSILYYLYVQLKDNGKLDMTASNLNMTLIFVVLGVAVGYLALRSLLASVVEIAHSKKGQLKEMLGSEKFQEITSGNQNEIAILAKSFNEITSRLEANIRSLEVAKKTLHSVLAKVGEGISSMQNIDNFLTLIIETVTDALQGRVGVLMLVDESQKELFAKSIYGHTLAAGEQIRIKFDEGTAGLAFKTKRAIIIPRLSSDHESGAQNILFQEPLLCAPLILRDKVVGVISVSGKKDDSNFNEEELNLLNNLAMQTAVAVENANLNRDAEKTYFETISALALAVDAKDHYSRGHLDRVAKYVVQIAEKLKLSQEEIRILRDAARLHDIGKIGISDDVLNKPGPLDTDGWSIMRRHTEIGEGIIKPISSLRNLCDIVRHHHEMLDGSGYPDGLKGDQIKPLVRILTVADIFDALTTDRPYRKAFSFAEGAKKLREMNDKIDQKIVDAFLEALNAERQLS
ncbi:MAG: HD domain-containing phosphohydrolase [Candidatus Omnitrophota bacterium]